MPKTCTTYEARHEARQYLIDAARNLKIYERGDQPEHDWALVVAAQMFAKRAAELLALGQTLKS